MVDNKGTRINEQIRVREVRLIDDEGEQKGIVPIQEALKMAKERELDLVEVAPTANPPVCKILDFGKYRFEHRRQRPCGSGDLDTKAKHVQEFLDEGNKVKVTIRFRGRELAHTELGYDVLKEVTNRLTSAYVIEKPAAMEGKFMSMTLSAKAKS